MKLLHLGLLIIGIIILIISSIRSEGFEMGPRNVDQRKYLKMQDKYAKYRLFPLDQGGIDTTKYLKLDDKFTEENKWKGKELKEVNPSAKIKISDVGDKIEQCKIIDKTRNCAMMEDSECGYCWYSDKIAYGDANGPKADVCTRPETAVIKQHEVCPKDYPHLKKYAPSNTWFCYERADGNETGKGGLCNVPKTTWGVPDGTWGRNDNFNDCPVVEDPRNGWVEPGPKAAYECEKKKERMICNTMKDCGDATGERSICGWCPIKGRGMVKKLTSNGKGWDPKYPDDDVCNWKEEVEMNDLRKGGETNAKYLGWTPDKGGFPNRDPNKGGEPLALGEGDCDTDQECAEGLLCGHNGKAARHGDAKTEDGIPGVLDPNTGKMVMPSARHRDYCYDPNHQLFHGSLIKPSDCEKFKQMFPCLGPNMFSGPHTDECLQSLFSKAGCSGKVHDRVKDQSDYKWWDTHAYNDVKNNMVTIRNEGLVGTDYKKAVAGMMKCYGRTVEPCEDRFKPRPLDCTRRLYNETGCAPEGKLNPEKQTSWPDCHVDAAWKRMQNYDASTHTYKANVINEKRQAQEGLLQPKNDFDKSILKNMRCYGKKPAIPWNKPCWTDFIMIMEQTPNIKLNKNTGNLNFSAASSSFKNLLPISNVANNCGSEYAWTGSYELSETNFKQKYFPFWNFIKTAKTYWNNNWGTFKTKMRGVPSVKGEKVCPPPPPPLPPPPPPGPRAKYMFDGCCRGTGATSWKMVQNSTTFYKCEQKCKEDSKCNAFEVNGCNRWGTVRGDQPNACNARCYLFYGHGNEIRNGGCVTSGDQKCYRPGTTTKKSAPEGTYHTFNGMRSNHFITQGTCNPVNLQSNHPKKFRQGQSGVMPTTSQDRRVTMGQEFCKLFYGPNSKLLSVPTNDKGTGVKIHIGPKGWCTTHQKRAAVAQTDSSVKGEPWIGDWAETTAGIANVKCS